MSTSSGPDLAAIDSDRGPQRKRRRGRPSLPAAELHRFTGSPRAWLALLAVLVVPLIYGGLYTWANESPLERVDQLAAAVVNLDEPVTLVGADGNEQLVPLGRQVVGSLTSSDSSSNYRWELTDAATADAGLTEGRYAAVLTIPADFSAAATSTSGSARQARSAQFQMRTNDAVNYLDGTIAKAIATAASDDAARTITESYLVAMYDGYGTLRDQLDSAADGATELSEGADDLSTGAQEAVSGAESVADGVVEIAAGATELSTGADQLVSGAGQAASGASTLSTGLTTLDTKVSDLPDQTRLLADGASTLSTGADGLKTAATQLKTSASSVSTGATTLANSIDPLETGASDAATGATDLHTGITAYTTGVSELAEDCEASGATPEFCASLEQVATDGETLDTNAANLETAASELSQSIVTLASGADNLASATTSLSTGVNQLATGATTLAPGSKTLADSLKQLADGMPALKEGISSASTGAATLASKLPDLTTGAESLADGATQLSGGAGTAAIGASELETGLTTLASGTDGLGTGAKDLSAGLSQGVSQIPDYTDSERAQLASVAAQPVTADFARVNAVHGNGSGMAPFFVALALWVGAISIYLLLRPLSPRALASSASSPLVALAGYLPGALLGAGQGLALALLLQFGVGIEAASGVNLIGVCLLAGLAFVALNQALVALFGTPGRFVAVLLTGVQLTAAGGTYPVQTAPAFFGWVHDALPLTHAVDALRLVITGSNEGLVGALGALVLTLVGSLCVSTWAAARQRTWTIRRLRPSVAA